MKMAFDFNMAGLMSPAQCASKRDKGPFCQRNMHLNEIKDHSVSNFSLHAPLHQSSSSPALLLGITDLMCQ